MTFEERWSTKKTIEKRAFQTEGTTWIKVYNGACIGNYISHVICLGNTVYVGESWERNLERCTGDKS